MRRAGNSSALAHQTRSAVLASPPCRSRRQGRSTSHPAAADTPATKLVPSHLGDPIAYRRDRRKNQLPRENGYLVLRFLAEDVGKELDMALDSTPMSDLFRGGVP
jgi:hypothetical protein